MGVAKFLNRNIPVQKQHADHKITGKAPLLSHGAVRPTHTPPSSPVGPRHSPPHSSASAGHRYSPPHVADNHHKLPLTGNINKGPGAGAQNTGLKGGSINKHKAKVNFNSKDHESVPTHGNLNKGPGAGAINSGNESGSINDSNEDINF